MDAFVESEMTFGPFRDECIFRIEKSKLLQKCDGVKTVEFVWRKKANDMRFVEAKKSSPLNTPGNETNYETFLTEISSKFVDSLNLYIAGLLERRTGYDEIPVAFKEADYSKMNFKFVLILKGHERLEPLVGLKTDLEKRLKANRRIWNSEVFVFNEQMARNAHYIN